MSSTLTVLVLAWRGSSWARPYPGPKERTRRGRAPPYATRHGMLLHATPRDQPGHRGRRSRAPRGGCARRDCRGAGSTGHESRACDCQTPHGAEVARTLHPKLRNDKPLLARGSCTPMDGPPPARYRRASSLEPCCEYVPRSCLVILALCCRREVRPCTVHGCAEHD